MLFDKPLYPAISKPGGISMHTGESIKVVFPCSYFDITSQIQGVKTTGEVQGKTYRMSPFYGWGTAELATGSPGMVCQVRLTSIRNAFAFISSGSPSPWCPHSLTSDLISSSDGHERVPPQGFESEASEGLQFPYRGFFMLGVIR